MDRVGHEALASEKDPQQTQDRSDEEEYQDPIGYDPAPDHSVPTILHPGEHFVVFAMDAEKVPVGLGGFLLPVLRREEREFIGGKVRGSRDQSGEERHGEAGLVVVLP